jgi:hypothetical protein
VELRPDITATQIGILESVHGKEAARNIPKMWAMYKEVADYYVDGVRTLTGGSGKPFADDSSMCPMIVSDELIE